MHCIPRQSGPIDQLFAAPFVRVPPDPQTRELLFYILALSSQCEAKLCRFVPLFAPSSLTSDLKTIGPLRLPTHTSERAPPAALDYRASQFLEFVRSTNASRSSASARGSFAQCSDLQRLSSPNMKMVVPRPSTHWAGTRRVLTESRTFSSVHSCFQRGVVSSSTRLEPGTWVIDSCS